MSRFFKGAALFTVIFVSFASADQSCIGIDYCGRLNSEQGPVGYQNCSCTCGQTRWLIDGTCPTCMHKHADGKTVGNIIDMVKNWFAGLSAYVEQKRLENHVNRVENTITDETTL